MTEKIKSAFSSYGLPRFIISAFFILLLILASVYNMNIPVLLGDVIRRWAMYGILVLAMVPGVQSGIGLNFGVTLGIIGGLLGSLVSVEISLVTHPSFADSPRLAAFLSLLIAIALGSFIAAFLGVAYGWLLNRLKGSEMTVSTYVGFSIVAFMNIMWLILPFKNGEIIWPVGGEGIRNTISLHTSFGEVLNNFLGFYIGGENGTYIPTGLILFFALFCFLVWLFLRSRTGMAMSAAGANPKYAKATGINVDRMRILGTTISTVLGAVGIVAYAQSYGFLQLYNAPLMMSFACVASVLIGGATIQKANIFNAILGTFLFQGILAVALPVANEILPEGNLSEVLRIIISNGIILYALTKTGGDSDD